MVKLEQIAIELLEYKVEDVQAERQVKGGVSSAWDLYNYLTKEVILLSNGQKKRVEDAGRILRLNTQSPKKPKSILDTFEELIISGIDQEPITETKATPVFEEAPVIEISPDILEEQTVLQRLAKRVWWSEMDVVIQELAAQCRAEKERATGRLLYALTRNLEIYAKGTSFATDVNLSRFKVIEPIPERLDPLVSLNNMDNLTDLIKEVLNIIVLLGEDNSPFGQLELPQDQSLNYVRRIAQAIARDPYAGQMTPVVNRGPTGEQIRLAIQELAKEPMREEQRQRQREALEERLRQTLAHERQQREVYQQDVKLFARVAKAFFDRLERYLPNRVGGEAGDPQLRGGVLFAENPSLRIDSVSKDASAVTIRLKGPTRIVLAGLEMAITGTGMAQSLFVGDKGYVLQPRLKIELGKQSILALNEGKYLFLRVIDEAKSLAHLIAEALSVLFILSAERKDQLLSVLKTAANVNVGEPQELISQAIARLQEMAAKAPSRRQAIEGLIRGASKAHAVVLPDHLVMGVVQRFYTAITVSANDLEMVLQGATGARAEIHALTDEPLSLTIAGQPVTVRKYRGKEKHAQESVVVMAPGRVIGSFSSYMVKPFPGGTLVCARSGNELASLFFEGVAIPI